MALHPFRCMTDSCLQSLGRSHVFHDEPKGTTPEDRLVPTHGCPECGNTDPTLVARLVTIHFVTPVLGDQKATHGTRYAYACDRWKKQNNNFQATDVVSAVTCSDCLEYIDRHPLPNPEDE